MHLIRQQEKLEDGTSMPRLLRHHTLRSAVTLTFDLYQGHQYGLVFIPVSFIKTVQVVYEIWCSQDST